MKCSNFVILLPVQLLCLVKYAASIMCYDCNSAFDPRCGEEFDPFSLGVVNCSLQDQPDHIPEMEPTICRTIKMEIYSKVRVVRKCGYLTEESSEQSCRRQSGNGDVFVTYCSCDTDLCNSSARYTAAFSLILALLFAISKF